MVNGNFIDDGIQPFEFCQERNLLKHFGDGTLQFTVPLLIWLSNIFCKDFLNLIFFLLIIINLKVNNNLLIAITVS